MTQLAGGELLSPMYLSWDASMELLFSLCNTAAVDSHHIV
jgi:hypothetical protein